MNAKISTRVELGTSQAAFTRMVGDGGGATESAAMGSLAPERNSSPPVFNSVTVFRLSFIRKGG